MKKIILLIVMGSLVLGCSSQQSETNKELEKSAYKVGPSEISFHVRTSDKEDLEIFEDEIIPWISIKDPEKSFENLVNKEEIVLKASKAILMIDYPLNKPVEIEIKSKGKDGFSRIELVRLISQEYNRIYDEEEASAEVKTVPLEEREGLINRNETDGKYGVWGHDIEDLDLSRIIVHHNNGIPKLELYIES